MSPDTSKACFATLALGRPFVFHAQQLAVDLRDHAPATQLLVFTDHVRAFRSHPNVIARPHRQRGVLRCFHDKRFMIPVALESFDTCILIDANIRILEPVPQDAIPSIAPGITAPRLYSVASKWESDRDTNTTSDAPNQETRVVLRALNALQLHPQKAYFVQEFLYAVRRDPEHPEAVTTWLAAWDALAGFFDFHRLAWSEGFGIGLAAGVTGFPVQCDSFLPERAYYKQRTYEFHQQTGNRPVTPAQEHCHREQRLLAQSGATRASALSVKLATLRRAVRFLAFRARHHSDQRWLEQLRNLAGH